MRFVFIFISLALLSIFSSPSWAENLTESDEPPRTLGVLLSWCDGGTEDDPVSQFKEISCLGYLQGVLDATSVMFGVNPEAKFFCPPGGGISTDQLLEILNEYVKQNPSALRESARIAVLVAYGKAFPCSVPPVQP